jgi:hypothetical protein
MSSLHLRSHALPENYRARSKNVRRDIWRKVWPSTPKRIRPAVLYLARLYNALKIEGRTFRWRIRNRLDKKYWAADLGPHLRQLPDGGWIEDERTTFRNSCIQELENRCPVATDIDVEIFLWGFDAGERFAFCNYGNLQHICAVAQTASNQTSNASIRLQDGE